MTRFGLICLAAALTIVGCLAASHVLNRIDRAQLAARTAAETAVGNRVQLNELVQQGNVLAAEASHVRQELHTCRVRTQALRDTLEVLIIDGVGWKDRVGLPMVGHLGWPEWPPKHPDLSAETHHLPARGGR